MPVEAEDGHSKRIYKKCDHGYCLNHSPQWERAAGPYFRANPSLFFKRTTFSARWGRHCEAVMQRMSKFILQRCRLCGREEEKLLEELVAYCRCCGYHYRMNTSMAQAIRDRLARFEASD